MPLTKMYVSAVTNASYFAMRAEGLVGISHSHICASFIHGLYYDQIYPRLFSTIDMSVLDYAMPMLT